MSAWKEIGETLKGVAPALATAFAGPVGGIVARTALNAVSGATGAPGAKPEQVLAALKDGAVDLDKLRTADREFETRMRELDIDLERVAAGDRDSARKYYAANREWFSSALDCIIIFGFFAGFGFATWLMFQNPDIPQHVTLFVGGTVGTLGTLAGQVVSFWRGSSRNEHKGKEEKP